MPGSLDFRQILPSGSLLGLTGLKPWAAEKRDHPSRCLFSRFYGKSLKNVQSIPFRIPTGVKLIRINAKTGTRAQARGKGTIIEAFKFHQNPNKLGEFGVTQFELPSGSNDEKPIGEIEGLY